MPDQKFLNIVSKIDNSIDLVSFIKDILTPQEIEKLDTRWQIICLLNQGLTQREIEKKLKCSISTVTKQSTQLKYGFGGLSKALLINSKK